MKPEFADNRDLTMLDALNGHLRWLRETRRDTVELSVATGYFNPQGFALLAKELEHLPRVRLLIGAEPLPPPYQQERRPGAPRGERYQREQLAMALETEKAGLERDRDSMPFAPETDRTVALLLEHLAAGRLEVRRWEQGFLHGKAYVFEVEEGTLVGSSNFTAAGLTSNLELNLGRYDPTPVRKVREWFDRLWEQAVPFDLAAIYQARYAPFDPYLIFLRVLWERYGHELEAEAGAAARIRLTTFQNDGIFRAQRIADKYGGVLIADGVGLGKSFIAGEILRRVIEDNRQRALLIAPATLRDGTWERFADRHQLYLETISYEQLAGEKSIGGEGGHYLKNRPEDYVLVVIDEAQAFRNPDTTRARALRRLLQGHPRKTLVLLSATPVNNSLWDLYYLLLYFVRNDAAFADGGVRSFKDRFSEVIRMDPDDLRPDHLFDILDATTVRRTRNFVKRYYPNDRIVGPGGVEMVVQFPTPHVKAVTYSLDAVFPGFFDEFASAMDPDNGPAALTLARYAHTRYKRRRSDPDQAQELREAALVGLLRSGLLKRFESSSKAFANTARKMADAHRTFLDALEQGYILTAEAIHEWEQLDSDDALEELVARTGSTSAKEYNVTALKRDVEHDLEILERFAAKTETVRAGNDPKLEQLVRQLGVIAQRAREEGLHEADVRDKRKVIVFSYFADTVNWIHSFLSQAIDTHEDLADFRGRLVAISGDHSPDGVTREDAVFGFAPRSSEAPTGRDEDRFDLLITTDVLAEGVNMQQARNIINYDLPWNPMRLVQRHGRIDRIGSPHTDVFIECFFPDERLDDLLALEERVRHKIAQAAMSIGVEYEVIPGAARADIVFAETRHEIERLRQEEAGIFENAGEDPSAHSGEEYRQELRKGLELYGDRVKTLPGGAGSGFLGGPVRGHFFCARVGERVFMRFVDWDVTDGSRQITGSTLDCLRRIRCRHDTPRSVPEDLAAGAYDAWSLALQHIHQEWMHDTDPANLQPKLRPTLRSAAEQVRAFPPSGIDEPSLARLIESLEAPWGARIERQIREALNAPEGVERSNAVARTVGELGLEPYRPPDPLPVIDRDEIRLVCWMAVDTAQ